MVELGNFSHIDLFLDKKKLLDKVTSIVAASVTTLHEIIQSKLSHIPFRVFTPRSATPLINKYESPDSLGTDRILASVGSYLLYPNTNVLTIDAGTCIKYNFVNQQNEFVGGAISPGFQMRLKALHEYTSALPLIAADFNYDKLTGTNTRDSILSGVLTATALEVEAVITQYKIKYPDLIVGLTGGDAAYLGKQLKNRFFTEPNLILNGLNSIQFHDR